MGARHKAVAGQVVTANGPWTEAILVCRKCSRKLEGGFGPDGGQSLAGTLKVLLRAAGRRRAVRVIQVGCLDICPKGGVVVVRGDRPGTMLIVPEGLGADALSAGVLGQPLTPSEPAGS